MFLMTGTLITQYDYAGTVLIIIGCTSGIYYVVFNQSFFFWISARRKKANTRNHQASF
jgi:hypothetical protein